MHLHPIRGGGPKIKISDDQTKQIDVDSWPRRHAKTHQWLNAPPTGPCNRHVAIGGGWRQNHICIHPPLGSPVMSRPKVCQRWSPTNAQNPCPTTATKMLHTGVTGRKSSDAPAQPDRPANTSVWPRPWQAAGFRPLAIKDCTRPRQKRCERPQIPNASQPMRYACAERGRCLEQHIGSRASMPCNVKRQT